MKRRIRRYNSYNWVTEEHHPPVLQIKGKMEGQMSAGCWKITGYFNRLSHIPQSLLDECVGDFWKDCTPNEAFTRGLAACLSILIPFRGVEASEVAKPQKEAKVLPRTLHSPTEAPGPQARTPFSTMEAWLKAEGYEKVQA